MSLLRLRSVFSVSSPINQLRRQISSVALQKHPTASGSATYPFPIPRDPSSPALKLPTDLISKFDYTASHVCAKVKVLTDLSNLDAAAEYARLAVLAVPKSPGDTQTEDTIAETCQCIIGAMCCEKRFEEAYDLFHYFFNVNNLKPDFGSCSYVVSALCRQGRLDEAIQFYRRTITYAHFFPAQDTLMNALIGAGRIDEAYGLFFGGFTYPVFIRAYLAHGNIDKATELFEDLKQQRERYPDAVAERFAMSQVAYMEHCFKLGKDEEAMELYDSVLAKYCLTAPKLCYHLADTVNTVLQVLLKYGKKTEAWSLYDKLCGNSSDIEKPEQGDGSILKDKWSNQETRCIMIRECFEMGEISKAMEIARKERCYITVLTSLLKQGMMSQAEEMFNEMFPSDRIPMYFHLWIHRMMVDGFTKAGRFDDAHRFVNMIADVSLRHVSGYIHASDGRHFVV